MNNHDELRDLLPLAAAGVLSEEEAGAVRRHIAQCASCARELESWERIAPDLTRLPSPTVPPWLAQRTINRIRQSREAAHERRWNNLVFAFLIAFSWALPIASWPIANLVTGELTAVVGVWGVVEC